MKITKLGHCCLVVEESDVRLLTDPGAYSTSQKEVKGLDAILITHEHADHLHMESLRVVLQHNPKARVITNTAVHVILGRENISSEIVGDGQKTEVNGLLIEGFGTEHGKVFESKPDVENTGYFIANKLFYPGDSFYNPGKHADVIALPVGGPWMKLEEALLFAKEMNPRVCFPVHDAIFNDFGLGSAHRWPKDILTGLGIQFVAMKEDSVENF